MDIFFISKAGKTSGLPPARAALAVRENGPQQQTRKRPTATTGSAAAAAKPAGKRSKPTALEKLLGSTSGGKHQGLSPAWKESFHARPPSRKRQLDAAPLQQQQQRRRHAAAARNTVADKERQLASASAQERRFSIEKTKAKRPLAVAALATARKARRYDMPAGNLQGAPEKPAPAVLAQQPAADELEVEPSEVAAATAVVAAEKKLPPPPPAAAPKSDSHTYSENQGAATTAESGQRRGTAAVVPAPPPRTGRMDEFFPRRVVLPSVRLPPRCPPPAPIVPAGHVSSPWQLGLASQHARPPSVRRCSRLRSRDHRDDDDDDADEDDGSVNSGRGGSGSEGGRSWGTHRGRVAGDTEEDEGGGEGDEQGRTVIRGSGQGSGGGPEQAENAGDDRLGVRDRDLGTLTSSAPPGSSSEGARVAAEAVAAAVPRSTARSEMAAPVAQKRAAALAAARGGAEPGAVKAGGEPETADQTAALCPPAAMAAAASAAIDLSLGVAEEAEATEATEEAPITSAAPAAAAATTWPFRRERGAASLFLSQRQRTGGLRCRGVGTGDAGRDVFRRQALSAVLAGGLRTQRLRMGRTSNSRTAAGVARGHPESQGVHGRVAGGVSCMEFDSVGWQLAVGGENVTVYDFDRYLPENARLKHGLVSGVRAYLQPTDGIETKRTVSCLRWNPANEEQLAVSYLNYDEVEVYDLRTVHPDRSATPVLALLPTTGSAAVAVAPVPALGVGGVFSWRNRSGGGGGGSGSSSSSSLSGKFRGLGHLAFEFVRRGPPERTVLHLVAGGRGGVVRVWRFFPETARQLAPYLEVRPFHRRGAHRPDVTAVCCLHSDAVLVGTDAGQLVSYSLKSPLVKNFKSSKDADEKNAWYLGWSAVWGGAKPPCADAAAAASGLGVQFLRLSPDHGTGVVLCGLRSGRVVIFDTGSGTALGITEPHRGVSIGYCPPPAAAPVPAAVDADADAAPGPAPLTLGEGATGPYGGGHWGPTVLACCKSSAGEGDEELVVLSTSARAALDSCKRMGDTGATRPGRKSGMRPGRGWEIGEAGGGGFRIEESRGYDLCLPVEVLAATPGDNRVRLSADMRGYLCSRSEVRLLRSRLVTSSVMIGTEKHEVEAVHADGTVLVLDREYRGAAVGGSRRRGKDDVGVAGGKTLARAPLRLPVASPGAGAGRRADLDADNGSEVDEPAPNASDGAGNGIRSISSSGDSAAGTAAAERAVRTGFTAAESALPPAACRAGAPAGGGDTAGFGPQHPPPLRQQEGRSWDRAWRPSRVRVFAKLKAVFGGGQLKDCDDIFYEALPVTEALPPPFALNQVVARAKLELPATAIASHPRMNFVLVGLADGTVAAVLPRARVNCA